MSLATVAASTSAASLEARARASRTRLPGSRMGSRRGRGGVAAPAAAMNAEQRARAARRAKAEAEAAPAPPAKPAAATMNPEQRARAARRAKMAKQQTARQRDEVAAPTPQKKAPEPEPVVAMSVEARARASRRRKMEELAAAAPVATAAKAEAAAASKASSSATAQAASAPGGDAPYKSSLFDDGAFEEALKGVNDVAAGLETASGGGPSIDWGGVAAARSLGEDDPFPGVGDLEPATATVASTPKTVEAAMASSAADGFVPAPAAPRPVPALAAAAPPPERQTEQVRSFLYPGEDQLPDDVNMTIWEHLEELRDRALVSAGACAVAILLCFCFAKDLVIFLEQPVIDQVKFLQLGPGEYFFTTVKVAGYCGLLLGAPVVLYEAIAYVVPGLTRDERKFLAPIVLGSSVLFYAGIGFAYAILTPAALKFFIGYSNEAVESLWSIDQYFEFVLVLLFSTGLSFQVPVIQLLLGQTGLVSSAQMLSIWRYVVVGSVVAAAVLTPSTDPFTQMLLAVPLMSLYLGGAALVGVVEKGRGVNQIEG